jgi:pimeloyl-ACP methyl ester carboxylesterase
VAEGRVAALSLAEVETMPRIRRAVPGLLLVLLAGLASLAAVATELWQTLPPTPTRPAATAEGKAPVDGVELYYAEYGSGPPVILLHGGLGNSDYWGDLIPALAPHYRVITMDSRGHGRSSRDAQPYGYDLMASDVVGLMDYLKLDKADIVGWSDGAIIGLDIAMNHPDRIGRLFAFAANSTVAGLKPDIDKNPTFAAYIERAGEEYKENSPTPDEYDAFLNQIGALWASQPNWAAADLARIKTPVLIVDGEHDEAIRLEHTEQLAKEVPGARLLILPGVSHFAMLQNPAEFNAAVLKFLGG